MPPRSALGEREKEKGSSSIDWHSVGVMIARSPSGLVGTSLPFATHHLFNSLAWTTSRVLPRPACPVGAERARAVLGLIATLDPKESRLLDEDLPKLVFKFKSPVVCTTSDIATVDWCSKTRISKRPDYVDGRRTTVKKILFT
jgi:hypothetical protein